MKVVSKPITVKFSVVNRKPTPHSFILITDGKDMEITIDKIIHADDVFISGVKVWVYTCQGIYKGQERLFEIRYTPSVEQWILRKI